MKNCSWWLLQLGSLCLRVLNLNYDFVLPNMGYTSIKKNLRYGSFHHPRVCPSFFLSSFLDPSLGLRHTAGISEGDEVEIKGMDVLLLLLRKG